MAPLHIDRMTDRELIVHIIGQLDVMCEHIKDHDRILELHETYIQQHRGAEIMIWRLLGSGIVVAILSLGIAAYTAYAKGG